MSIPDPVCHPAASVKRWVQRLHDHANARAVCSTCPALRRHFAQLEEELKARDESCANEQRASEERIHSPHHVGPEVTQTYRRIQNV